MRCQPIILAVERIVRNDWILGDVTSMPFKACLHKRVHTIWEAPLLLSFSCFFVLHNMWVIQTENQFSDNYTHGEHLLSNIHFEHLIWRYMDIMVIFLSWNPSWVVKAANFNVQLLHGSCVCLLGYLFICLNIISLMIIEIKTSTKMILYPNQRRGLPAKHN